MPTLTTSGVNLYYELTGNDAAPTVVFINGLFQDTTSWALAVRALAPRFRTLTYDCRGQGQSDKPLAGPYLPETHARDLAALLDALDIRRTHFVGLSNGGIVLQHFARLFPERLDRLVLADTLSHVDAVQRAMLHTWRLGLETGGTAMRFMIALPWLWGADFLERNYDAIMALRDKAVQTLPTYSSLHLVDGALTHDARGWLAGIAAPVLVVNGEQDLIVQMHHARFLQSAIPGARLHIIADAGHAAWLEKAGEFNQVVEAFLDGLPGTGN